MWTRALSGLTKRTLSSDSAPKWIPPKGFVTKLKIYNPRVKEKVSLVTKSKGIVSWYSCGPTVYDSAHIGHACCYVTLDTIRRILENVLNLNVVSVMGVTDIDDKIIKRANELGQDFTSVSRFYEKEFFEDMESLNILKPNATARVSDFIPEVKDFIEQIMRLGAAYVASDGSVYFSVQHFEKYGKLVRLSEEEGDVDPVKRHPWDFALWKAAKEGEPFWESPWGPGRPGWHIECSAMASHFFGSSLDVHCGGIDLRFPHHENEEAQSCAYHCNAQWVNYWIHTGHLFVKGDVKMSKSLKNTISIREFLQSFSPDNLRMFCLLSPYRGGMEYSPKSIETAVGVCRNFDSFISDAEAYIKGLIPGGDVHESDLLSKLASTKEETEDALLDDFNTPRAIECLGRLASGALTMIHEKPSVEGSRSPYSIAAVANYVKGTLSSLGYGGSSREDVRDSKLTASVLDSSMELRSEVRQVALGIKKSSSEELLNVKKALLGASDSFRNKLLIDNIELKDHGSKTSWNFVDDSGNKRTNSD